jgi:flagellar biosynthesis chaperone FliJ
MPPKKATATCSIISSIYPNQGNKALIREARNQKKKFVNSPPHEEEIDEEINNLELIHQQVEECNEKWFAFQSSKERLMKQLKRCAISKRTKI